MQKAHNNNCSVYFIPAVVVGFFETSYEMHAGELKRVCVQAVGKLQKSVSVNLSVRETTGVYIGLQKA